MMKKEITIFTLIGCSHCMLLKTNLDHLSIPYKEIEVTKNPKIWEEILQQTKQDRLPTVFISEEDKDEGKIYIPEIDFQTIDEMVGIIKSIFKRN